ncbi:MAG: glycosyl transferase, partial [Candidatus Krumholzibacteriia bacterium]
MSRNTGWPAAVLGPFHPYRGGIAHHTTLLARTLATDHPVLGVNFTRLYPSFLFPGRTQYDESADPLKAADVRVRRLVDSVGPHTWLRAARAVRDAGARLLVAQWWHPFFAPAYASVSHLVRRHGVRVVYLCHNVLPHESTRLDGLLVRVGLGAAHGYLVHSETDRAALEMLFPDRPYVLTPLPAFGFFSQGRTDRETARQQLQLDGHVVLFFGL